MAEKFIRVASGAVYRYTDMLAKRRDAVVVGKKEFDAFIRSATKRAVGRPKNAAPEPVEEPSAEEVDDVLSGVLNDGSDVRASG